MRHLWLFVALSLLGLQTVPLTSASMSVSGSSSTALGAVTISPAPSLKLTTNETAIATSLNFLSINGSTKAKNISGLLTVLKTGEFIPLPVPSDSVVACELLESTKTLISDVPPFAMSVQRATLPTRSCSAEMRSSFKPTNPSISQKPLPQPISTMLRTIIVGGNTYVPVHTHHTHRNAASWQEPPRASQTNSEGIDRHEYYAKHVSELDGVGPQTPKSNLGQEGLPPVVVGTLTYGPKGQEYESRWQTSAPVDVAGSATETAELATSSLMEEWTTLLPAQSGSVAAKSQHLVFGSQTPTALAESSGLNVDSSTLLPGSPAAKVNSATNSLNPSPTLTMKTSDTGTSGAPQNTAVTTTSRGIPQTTSPAISGQSIIPASPPTFIIASQTFTAYPLGLVIGGTEVFQGSTAITVSGTAISLGSSDILIGTSTIPIASVTGLGAALSSGLATATSASGGSLGPTTASTKGVDGHRSAAGRSTVTANVTMLWLVTVGFAILVIQKMKW